VRERNHEALPTSLPLVRGEGGAKYVYLETLGCPRNQVDTERAAALLLGRGFLFANDPVRAHLLVLNTCSFLSDARREAFDRIRALSAIKARYVNKIFVVLGCLPQLWGRKGRKLFPLVDHWLGIRGWRQLPAVLAKHGEGGRGGERRSVREGFGPWYAYLKISEGCSRECSYCLIPKIRGQVRLRPRLSVLREAEFLAANGVKELILVAQDSTACAGRGGLPGLLKDLAQEALFPWIRVLYAHPVGVDEQLAEALAALPGVLPYLDMPIQHASPRVLRLMGRWPGPTALSRTVRMLRRTVPGIALRTTVMVGFPGERAADFRQVQTFIRRTAFDHVGIFTYSREPGTSAFRYRPHVPPDTRRRRQRALALTYGNVRRAHLRKLIGNSVEAIVDATLPDGTLLCRPWWSAPDIDGYLFADGQARVGERVVCRVEAIRSWWDLEGWIEKVT
jgi:ribosomal protein S12 methylthiotransferase